MPGVPIDDLFAEDRLRVEGLGRSAGSALRVHDLLEQFPVVTVPHADRRLSLSRPTITSALENLIDLGIVREVSGRNRGRVYVYTKLLEILSEGTEPLDPPDEAVRSAGRTEAAR